MRSRDVHATTAGVLFIAATATSLVATALLGSVLNGPGVLATVALHQNRLLAAALFQLLAAFTSAAIAVTLYPVLRQHAAATAAAYAAADDAEPPRPRSPQPRRSPSRMAGQGR